MQDKKLKISTMSSINDRTSWHAICILFMTSASTLSAPTVKYNKQEQNLKLSPLPFMAIYMNPWDVTRRSRNNCNRKQESHHLVAANWLCPSLSSKCGWIWTKQYI
jgi:hypothetical protein